MLLALLIILVFQSASGKLLNMSPCNIYNADKSVDTSFTREHVTRVSTARTDVECLVNCRNSDITCESVYYSQDSGQCNEYSVPNYKTSLQPADVSNAGTLFSPLLSPVDRSSSGTCNEEYCSENHSCLSWCRNSSEIYCLPPKNKNCKDVDEFSNLRHYWSETTEDTTKSGVILRVTYPKEETSSALRVTLQITTMATNIIDSESCVRWYFTFNGEECTDPAAIEYTQYSKADVKSFPIPSTIDGTCYGLSAEDILINLKTGSCDEHMLTDSVSTGYSVAMTLLIMEVNQHNINELPPCSSALAFNYQYYTWTEAQKETFDTSNEQSRLLHEVQYKKLLDESTLHIKYSAMFGLRILTTDVHCGRWYITINDQECLPQPADAVVLATIPSQNVYYEKFLKVSIAEAICTNSLPAGDYSIKVLLGSCKFTTTAIQPTTFYTGGYSTPSRLHVKEVLKETPSSLWLDSQEGKMHQSLTGHVSSWSWPSLRKITEPSDVFNTAYIKKYSSTALRLTINTSHKLTSFGGGCALWYFTIDGAECTNPGPINGMLSVEYKASIHLPVQVSGVCHSIPTGAHILTYSVKPCPGMSFPSSSVGAGIPSSVHFFVDELRVDSVKVCDAGPPIDCDA